jgi:hypothetical protein
MKNAGQKQEGEMQSNNDTEQAAGCCRSLSGRHHSHIPVAMKKKLLWLLLLSLTGIGIVVFLDQMFWQKWQQHVRFLRGKPIFFGVGLDFLKIGGKIIG